VEAQGDRAHYIDGASEPYNGGARHARLCQCEIARWLRIVCAQAVACLRTNQTVAWPHCGLSRDKLRTRTGRCIPTIRDRARTWTVHGLIVASSRSRTGHGCGLSVDMDNSCPRRVRGLIEFVDGARTRREHCMALLWLVLGNWRDTSQLLLGYCAEITVDISRETAVPIVRQLRGHCVDCRRIFADSTALMKLGVRRPTLNPHKSCGHSSHHLMQQAFSAPVHFGTRLRVIG
jgi:hypothetical protein